MTSSWEDEDDDRKPPARNLAVAIRRGELSSVDEFGSFGSEEEEEDHHRVVRSESALPLYRDAYHSKDSTMTLAASAAALGFPQSVQHCPPRVAAPAAAARLPARSAREGIPRSNTAGASPSSLTAVEFEPKGWQKKKQWNSLHVALSNKVEPWKIKLLVESNPAWELERNADGNNPLQEGLKSRADVAELVGTGSVAAISMVNNDGEYPLHIACERNASESILSKLVQVYPAAIKAQTNKHYQTPLHYLIYSKAATAPKVKLLLRACPEVAKIRDKYGMTAFNMGVNHGAPKDILHALYDAFPEAAGLKPTEDASSLDPSTTSGLGAREAKNTPVELATAFQDGITKGEQLDEELRAYIPNGYRQRHQYNMLHVALTKGAPVELIRLMLEMNPKLAGEKNSDGNCPLMEGLVANASEESLHAVLDVSETASCNFVNNNNEYALHFAAPKVSSTLLRRILNANTEATMAQSLNEEEMPLHRLMSSQYSDDMVDEMISKFRKAARVRDRFERTPLHAAVNNRAPKYTIFALIKVFPDALGIEDTHKRTPLNDSIFLDYVSKEFLKGTYESSCNERGFIVNDVLKEYKPRGSHIGQGWNCLHVAMSKGAQSWEIDVLLDSSPNLARKQNEAGNFPISEGLLQRATDQSIADVLIAHMDACKTPNNNGEYALHHAANSSSPMIIEMVKEIHPEAVSCVSRNTKRTPLHMLVGRQDRQVELSSVQQLAKGDAIEQRDANGDTPLHAAIKNCLQMEHIRFLLFEYPQAANIPDGQGHLPLHHAIQNRIDDDLLINLLRVNPDAVRMKFGSEGYLPLHMAMKYCSGSAFTDALIEQNDKVASIQASDGSTPLSLALKHGADYDSFASVLNNYDGAWKVADAEDMLPLHIAMMRGAPKTIVTTLIAKGPDAFKYRNKYGHTPFLAGIVPAMQILQHRHPASFQPLQMRGDGILQKSSLQSKNGSENSPFRDLLALLDNLDQMLSDFPEVSEQRDRDGNLPLLLFSMTFNPSVIRLTEPERRTAMQTITRTLEKIFSSFPQAAQVTGPFVGTPINVLVGECSLANSAQELILLESSKRLGILLQNARDGRALQPLCNLESKISLFAFFVLFDENRLLPNGEGEVVVSIDLNREMVKGWSVLDILADFDTSSSAGVLLQILRDQKMKMDSENNVFQILNEDDVTLIEFRSLETVSEAVRTRIADRAKLVNSSTELRLWGQAYGRFLKRYRLDKQPKHVSETCVVVFGTEAIKQDGQIGEHPVALKFMDSLGTFLREVKKRPVLDDKGTSSQYVFPIRETFSSRGIDEFKCEKVDLQTELEPYKETIKLEGSVLKYVIVMDCGAGYDLHDFISHQNVAGKDLLTVTTIAKEIALCLKFLNENCGIIHGDVKARNFVAKGVGFIGFAAIDLDNASTIGREPAGLKQTSSGYLPPEQAAVEAFERSNGTDPSAHKPPPVVASPQYDMWCFGVLLYFLFTGKQLFNVDTKEDVDDDDLLRILSWESSWKKDKLSKVNKKWPLKLLDSLLQKNPANRPDSWSSVVDELNKVTIYSDNVLYDTIVIFQSSPLVFISSNGDIKPMVQLDFDKETDMLKGALADAEQVGCTIDVILETGSLDRLHSFMAQKMTRVMHFSGHGTLQYMAWEDERGKLKMLREHELKRQIEGIGTFLRCVFVSACHSQWVAQAFIDAGVRHAICCPVDESLLDIAASEFTRNFYRNLACKMTVKQAFKAARTAVSISPHVANREKEAKKFLLLPEMPDDSDYHDVPIFFASETRPIQDDTAGTMTIGVPRYRQLLVGRNVIKYSILNSLSPDSTVDVVRVWGKEGMGKTALVADVCNHIRLRPRSPPQLDHLFWFPPTGEVLDNSLYQSFFSLLDSSICVPPDHHATSEQLRYIRREIAGMIVHKSILLVIDVGEFQKTLVIDVNECQTSPIGDISRLFQDAVAHLLEVSHAKYLKAVFIEESPPTQTDSIRVREETVPVMELDIDAAVTLFAHCVPENLRRKYPILNSRTKLFDQLLDVPQGINISQDELDDREDFVWDQYLGSGEPHKCCDIARDINEDEIKALLKNWWEKPKVESAKEPAAQQTHWDDDDFPEFM